MKDNLETRQVQTMEALRGLYAERDSLRAREERAFLGLQEAEEMGFLREAQDALGLIRDELRRVILGIFHQEEDLKRVSLMGGLSERVRHRKVVATTVQGINALADQGFRRSPSLGVLIQQAMAR